MRFYMVSPSFLPSLFLFVFCPFVVTVMFLGTLAGIILFSHLVVSLGTYRAGLCVACATGPLPTGPENN